MTVDGSDDRPLALREFAHTDSPELVHAALGRFRRRLFVRGLILVLIVAGAFVLYPRYFGSTGDLASEIENGRGVVLFNTVKAGNVEATLFRVARLSHDPFPDGRLERFGIHLLMSGSLAPDEQVVPLLRRDFDRGVLAFRTQASGNIANGFEMWISLRAGTRAIDIPFARVAVDGGTATVAPPLGMVHIDMETLAVPDWTWR